MNEYVNKLVKQPRTYFGVPISNTELAPTSITWHNVNPTSITLHNVKEFVDHRGQLPRLSQEARLAIRAYQRGGLKALSNASDDVVDGLKLLGVSGRLKKRLRGLYRELSGLRSLGVVSIGLGAGLVIAALEEFSNVPKDFPKIRPTPNDDPDLVPKEGLGDLGITPGNIDTFTIIADLGSAITSNEENVGVESAESVVRHVARYLERIGFSHSDTSIAYVCLPKRVIGQEIGGYSVYDRGWFFRKCYEDWDSREEAT